MDALPDKTTFLDLMVAGSPVAPSKVKADTPDGRHIVYDDLHPRVLPAANDQGAKFDLTAGDMPAALAAYDGDAEADRDRPYRLISRRTKHRFNSTGGHLSKLKAKRTTNPAHIHPDDMAALGLTDGAIARIESEVGFVFAVTEADDDVLPGTISMAHAWGDPDVGIEGVRDIGGGTNRLVSETSRFDSVTGQSLQSAIPVSVVAA